MVQGMETDGEERDTFSLCNATLVPAAAEETLLHGSLSSKNLCSAPPPCPACPWMLPSCCSWEPALTSQLCANRSTSRTYFLDSLTYQLFLKKESKQISQGSGQGLIHQKNSLANRPDVTAAGWKTPFPLKIPSPILVLQLLQKCVSLYFDFTTKLRSRYKYTLSRLQKFLQYLHCF